MKFRLLVIVLLCAMLFCTACHGDGSHPVIETDPPTTESTEESSSAATTDPQPDPPVWYVADLTYESYEDFFGTDRTLEQYYSNSTWYIRQGKDLLQFGFDWTQNDRMVIQNGENGYLVPGSETLTDYSRIGADGHYAYLYSHKDVIRVDLFSGATEAILTCDQLLAIECYDSLVMVYLAEQAGICSISRMYLPTLTVDVIYEGIPADAPLQWFSFPTVFSTQAPFHWTMLNPEMVTLLQKELSNPESIYKINSITQEDYSSIWGDPALTSRPGLIWDMQTRSGIPAWLQWTYDPSDGSLSEKTGIIDRCWVGSGYAHDHFDPNEYDVTPVWNVSSPVSIEDILLPEEPEMMYEEDVYAYMRSNYVYVDGSVYLQTEDNLLQFQFDITLKEYRFAPDALYGITPDNTLVQVRYDGTICNRLYTAEDTTLSDLVYGCGKLYFMANNTLTEIDIPTKTCRSLMNISCLQRMYLDAPNQMFIETAKGLSVGMYVADFTNLTLQDTHRL